MLFPYPCIIFFVADTFLPVQYSNFRILKISNVLYAIFCLFISRGKAPQPILWPITQINYCNFKIKKSKFIPHLFSWHVYCLSSDHSPHDTVCCPPLLPPPPSTKDQDQHEVNIKYFFTPLHLPVPPRPLPKILLARVPKMIGVHGCIGVRNNSNALMYNTNFTILSVSGEFFKFSTKF